MKFLSACLAGALVLSLSGCVYVRFRGDLAHSGLLDDDPLFPASELDPFLTEAGYDLDLSANLWRTKARWTVQFAGPEPDRAFQLAREAVLRRVAREEGRVTSSHDEGAAAWRCTFELDGDPGEASVRLLEDCSDRVRPHQLEIFWRESN